MPKRTLALFIFFQIGSHRFPAVLFELFPRFAQRKRRIRFDGRQDLKMQAGPMFVETEQSPRRPL